MVIISSMSIAAIAAFVAEGIASFALSRKLTKLFDKTPKEEFESKFTNVVHLTIDEFKKKHQIEKQNGKYPFYESQSFLLEFIKIGYFTTDNFENDLESIINKLSFDKKIIIPNSYLLNQFFEIFKNEINKYPELRHAEYDSRYKEQIFINTFLLNKILDILENNGLEKEPPPNPLTDELPTINKEYFIGRKETLQKIRDFLCNEKITSVTNINGMGGIGKTAVASIYVQGFYDEYSHVAWFTIDNDLETTIKGSSKVIQSLSIDTNVKGNGFIKLFFNSISAIKSGKPKLIVFDNARSNLQEFNSIFKAAQNCHILITSRERMKTFKEIELEFLDKNEALELFRLYNKSKSITDEQIKYIAEEFEYHTLTIEILAKASGEFNWSYGQIVEALPKDSETEISIFRNKDKQIERIRTYIAGIFDITELSEWENYILKQFVCLPNQWLSYKSLQSLFQQQKLVENDSNWENKFGWAFGKLHNKGLLMKDEENDAFKLHPVLNEVLSSKLKIDFEDVKYLVEVVSNLLALDQTTDNPVHKFRFIPFGEALVKQFERVENEEISTLLNRLGIILIEAGFYQQAANRIEKALEINLKIYGEKHPSTASSRSNLATVYKDLGRYKESAELLETALASVIENYGEKHPSTAISRSNLALVYQDLGMYKESAELLETALASDIENYGEKHPSTARSRSNLALVYQALGRYKESAELLETALASVIENYGEKHPSTAISRSNLATVYKALGRYKESAEQFEKSLEVVKKELGDKHPNVAVVSSNLALVYQALGRYEEAEKNLLKTLSIHIEIYEPEHPYVWQSVNLLAQYYFESKQPQKGVEFIMDQHSFFKEKLGENHQLTQELKKAKDAIIEQLKGSG